MSRIPMHTLESAPVAARPVLETLVARSPTPGVPINLHAQMAHAPSVLIGYMAMRKALDEHGTFDPKTRTAILLTVAAADKCAYTVALNTLIARQAGWNEDETLALRKGHVQDVKLAALLAVARQSATNHGHVDEPTWQTALDAGWTDAQLAEAFAFVGLAQYVDSFINYARTDIDAFAQKSVDGSASIDQDMSLTVLLIVEDQDRTRAFYEQWRSRGAHFLTPPIQLDGEIRCYLRDPDGHLIEVGQSLRS